MLREFFSGASDFYDGLLSNSFKQTNKHDCTLVQCAQFNFGSALILCTHAFFEPILLYVHVEFSFSDPGTCVIIFSVELCENCPDLTTRIADQA